MADTVLVPRVTTTTAANVIPELWSAEVLRATRARLIMADKVKRYDYMVKSKGDTIHVPNLSNLTTNSKVASTIVTVQAPTDTNVDILINQHEEASFIVEDIAKVQSEIALLSEYTNQAGYAVAKKVDSDLLGLYSGLSQSVGSGSVNITDANIISAIQYLDNADAPEQDRTLIINPAGKADLMAIDKFVLRTGPGWSPNDSPILNGEKAPGYFGDLYGVKVFISTNVAVETASPNVVHGILFHKEAFALAMQQSPRTQSQYKQEYLGTLVTVDVIYGVKELRDLFAVDFRFAV